MQDNHRPLEQEKQRQQMQKQNLEEQGENI